MLTWLFSMFNKLRNMWNMRIWFFKQFHCQHSLTEAWTNFYMIQNFPRYCNLCEHELIADSMVTIHMVHGNVAFKNMTWFGSFLVIETSANKNPKLIGRLKMHLWRKHVRRDVENVTIILQAILLSTSIIDTSLSALRSCALSAFGASHLER